MKNLQQQASSPYLSCWVNASAGTGKTKVLIDRILRLLLLKEQPERILCLTFSKAAANEMLARLGQKLKSWSMYSDVQLQQELEQLGEKNSLENIEKAKKLYALVQRSPLSIQTVHSFCNKLLQKFLDTSFENTIPRVMEIFEEKTYLDKAFQVLLSRLDLQSLLEEFLAFHNEQVLFEYLCKSKQIYSGIQKEQVLERLFDIFEIREEPCFPKPDQYLIEIVEKIFQVSFSQSKSDISLDDSFVQVFLTQKGIVRKKILTKQQKEIFFDANIAITIYGESLANYFIQKNRYLQVQKSFHFWQLQQEFQIIYKELKKQKKVWDFDDLIVNTQVLFEKDAFDQILLSLNYQIDHVLIDEAQDTSINQWSIIYHLVEGLFNSENPQRTLFVVGDQKQLIYSFQGADINAYQNMRKLCSNQCHPWQEIDLIVSFRSAQRILDCVDAVFEKAEGLGDKKLKHKAHFLTEGHINCLPLIKEEPRLIYEEWPVFTEYQEQASTEDLLAEQVFNHLEEFHKKHNTAWKDVMILMRRRGQLMDALVKKAITKKIPYTASNAKNLLEHLAVQDLLSIVEFMIMPLNDLNLAALLKSPFMQKVRIISEEELFELCYKRTESLWNVVQKKLPRHAAVLENLLKQACNNGYEYFLKAFQAFPVKDIYLENFLEEVFKRFLHLDLGVRELLENLYFAPPQFREANLDEEGVKILTVHSAKGLESKVVLLLDMGDKPNLQQEVCLYDPVLKCWFLKPPQQADTILTTALKEYHQKATEHEFDRLFYVALTRAKQFLFVGGIDHEPHPHSWYWRVEAEVKKCLVSSKCNS